MSLEELEKELYKKNFPGRPRGSVMKKTKFTSAEETKEIPEFWEEEPEKEEKARPPFRKVVFSVLGVLALVLFVGAVLFIWNDDSRNRVGVTLEIIGPSEIYRGVPFDLIVEVANTSENFLTNNILNFNLPSGLVYLNVDSRRAQHSITVDDLGDIAGGGFLKRTFKFLAVGPDNTLQKINAVFSYNSGAKSRFEAARSKEILIKGPAIEAEVRTPESILTGADFNLEIRYRNVSNFDLQDVQFKIDYPSAFKFVSASFLPDSLQNNVWRLGELNANSKGDFQIRGRLEGVAAETRLSFPVIVLAAFAGKEYKIVDKIINLSVAPSPIDLSLTVNNSPTYIARAGDNLTYSLRYQNRSGIALFDVVIHLSLAGEMFDFKTLNSDGNIDSISNSLTWNAFNAPELRLLSPGASGEVTFNIKLKSAFPIKRLSDKNFTLRASAEVSSPSVPYYLVASTTTAFASLETKVAGMINVDAQAFYRDAPSGIANAGTLPPKVNTPTEYTIHWIIKNYSTDVKNVRIAASLGPGVILTNLVKSNIDSVPLWNDRTQEVVWDIPKILATKGVISDPVEAIFQVRATPNSNMVYGYQTLLRETTLTAIDDFTGMLLQDRDDALTTELTDDPSVGPETGKVMPQI